MDAQLLRTQLDWEQHSGRPYLRAIIGAFVESTPLQIERIRESVGSGSYESARMAAHALRGGALQIGARLLVKLCEELEASIARDVVGKESTLARLANDIGIEFVAARAALTTDWLQRLA